jgi:hypothetical protein
MMKKLFISSVLLLFVTAQPHASRAADDLPARLSDSEFWQLVSDLSEPNGQFQYENFVSNEYNLQWVIPTLLAKGQPASAYIGVGPEQNFTYIAALRPKIAFVIDIRRQNLLEHLMYKAIFDLSRNRSDFVSLLFSRKGQTAVDENATAAEIFRPYQTADADRNLFEENLTKILNRLTIDHRFALSDDDRKNIRYVYSTFSQHGPALDYTVGGFYGFDAPPNYADLMTADDGQGNMRSFLASEGNFQIVRKLETDNLIIPVVGDFGGPTAVREVGRYITAHHGIVTAFYLSNVERYLFNTAGAWRKFYVNVAVLPYDKDGVFIRSIFDASYGSDSKLSGIDEIMTAFSGSRIRNYGDVIALSH